MPDNATSCPACGTSTAPQNPTAAPVNTVDPFDHTAEFSAKDISDNKVVSMLVYLMGVVGIIIAALVGGNSSPYVAFHIRQSLKFLATEALMGIAMGLLCWTILVPVAGVIMFIVFYVLKIICFFQICAGQAKEPAIIRSLKFLK